MELNAAFREYFGLEWYAYFTMVSVPQPVADTAVSPSISGSVIEIPQAEASVAEAPLRARLAPWNLHWMFVRALHPLPRQKPPVAGRSPLVYCTLFTDTLHVLSDPEFGRFNPLDPDHNNTIWFRRFERYLNRHHVPFSEWRTVLISYLEDPVYQYL